MSKNLKNKESDSDSETTTDTETEPKKTLTKSKDNDKKDNDKKDNDKKDNDKKGLSKKAKIYIAITVVLLVIGGYMWYKNKKNKANGTVMVQNNNGTTQNTMAVPQTSNPVAQSVMVSQGVPDF